MGGREARGGTSEGGLTRREEREEEFGKRTPPKRGRKWRVGLANSLRGGVRGKSWPGQHFPRGGAHVVNLKHTFNAFRGSGHRKTELWPKKKC